jgi:hypothetical protein
MVKRVSVMLKLGSIWKERRKINQKANLTTVV